MKRHADRESLLQTIDRWGDFLKELRDQFEITAHPQNAGQARERIRTLAIEAGFAGLDLGDIEIATGEAVTNAILYGSPDATSQIRILCRFTGNSLHIEIRDQGQGFDPTRVPEDVGTDALGGRGIRLMRALMDQVDLHHDGNGMVARLSKTLHG